MGQYHIGHITTSIFFGGAEDWAPFQGGGGNGGGGHGGIDRLPNRRNGRASEGGEPLASVKALAGG